MQVATTEGLISEHFPSRRRYVIACVHGAPEQLQASLVEEWSKCNAKLAYDKLGKPDVHVTNESDKELQLRKVLELDEKVQALAPPSGSRGGTPLIASVVIPEQTLQGKIRWLEARAEKAELALRNAERKLSTDEDFLGALRARAEGAEARIVELEKERDERATARFEDIATLRARAEGAEARIVELEKERDELATTRFEEIATLRANAEIAEARIVDLEKELDELALSQRRSKWSLLRLSTLGYRRERREGTDQPPDDAMLRSAAQHA